MKRIISILLMVVTGLVCSVNVNAQQLLMVTKSSWECGTVNLQLVVLVTLR